MEFRVVSYSFFGILGTKYAHGISENLKLMQVKINANQSQKYFIPDGQFLVGDKTLLFKCSENLSWLVLTTTRQQRRSWKWYGWYTLPSPVQLICVRQQKKNYWLFLCFSFDICSVKTQNGLHIAKVSYKQLRLSPCSIEQNFALGHKWT